VVTSGCAPKPSDAPESRSHVPVPLKLTVCGLFAASSLIESDAVRLPVADGVNVTLSVQVPLGVSVAPAQVSALLAKSLAFEPVSPTLVMVRFAVPLLVTVRPWPALAVPTS